MDLDKEKIQLYGSQLLSGKPPRLPWMPSVKVMNLCFGICVEANGEASVEPHQ